MGNCKKCGNVIIPKGPKGDTGAKGDKGDKGDIGNTGANGNDGVSIIDASLASITAPELVTVFAPYNEFTSTNDGYTIEILGTAVGDEIISITDLTDASVLRTHTFGTNSTDFSMTITILRNSSGDMSIGSTVIEQDTTVGAALLSVSVGSQSAPAFTSNHEITISSNTRDTLFSRVYVKKLLAE